MPNEKIYIHEFIDIIGHNRAKYMHHMTANWSPIAQEERNQLCYGVWGVVGTTRGWPEVVNLWEEDGSLSRRVWRRSCQVMDWENGPSSRTGLSKMGAGRSWSGHHPAVGDRFGKAKR